MSKYGAGMFGQIGVADVASTWDGAKMANDLSILGDGEVRLARQGWGSWSEVHAINAVGQLAGYANYPAYPDTIFGPTHATLWNGTVATDLGTLGGSYSRARGINDFGLVVGESATTDGTIHATLWNGTTSIDLGTSGALTGDVIGGPTLQVELTGVSSLNLTTDVVA